MIPVDVKNRPTLVSLFDQFKTNQTCLKTDHAFFTRNIFQRKSHIDIEFVFSFVKDHPCHLPYETKKPRA